MIRSSSLPKAPPPDIRAVRAGLWRLLFRPSSRPGVFTDFVLFDARPRRHAALCLLSSHGLGGPRYLAYAASGTSAYPSLSAVVVHAGGVVRATLLLGPRLRLVHMRCYPDVPACLYWAVRDMMQETLTRGAGQCA